MPDSDTHSRLTNLKQQLNVSKLFAPLNLQEQRVAFLANPNFNPHFEYPEFDKESIANIQSELEAIGLTTEDSLEKWILERKIEELKLEIEMCLSRGTAQLNKITAKLFNCSFKSQYLKSAELDANSPLPFESKENKTAEEIVRDISTYLESYNIFDWNVTLSDQSDFYFRVRADQKTLLISKNFNWDFCDFDNMLAHEIDGHVIRGINAFKQSNPLLQTPLPFYIKTEEGLASFLGDYCSSTAEISRKHHALKYLAGHLAQTASFLEVFEFLCQHGFTAPLAFQRTFRLKRGFTDTSMHGCFAKEAMYYEGMLEVKEFLDRGGEIKKLYAGKVGLADLDKLALQHIPEKLVIPQRVTSYLEK